MRVIRVILFGVQIILGTLALTGLVNSTDIHSPEFTFGIACMFSVFLIGFGTDKMFPEKSSDN